jgi:hypothetical protein
MHAQPHTQINKQKKVKKEARKEKEARRQQVSKTNTQISTPCIEAVSTASSRYPVSIPKGLSASRAPSSSRGWSSAFSDSTKNRFRCRCRALMMVAIIRGIDKRDTKLTSGPGENDIHYTLLLPHGYLYYFTNTSVAYVNNKASQEI